MELVEGCGKLRGELTELASGRAHSCLSLCMVRCLLDASRDSGLVGGQADFLTLSYEGAGAKHAKL